jgi:cytidylate kinase
LIVALDGPAGVGKSTIASVLAEKAGFFYLNSGNFYRAVTLSVLQKNIDPADAEAIIINSGNISIRLTGGRIHLDGRDVENELHSDRVDQYVAQHSAIVGVRKIVTEALRAAAESHDVVAEGRDITTVVFPDAEIKFYLDASIDVRAKRRFDQGTSSQSLDQLKESLGKRDEIDKNKPVGSLKLTYDAIYLDTSDLTIDEVCERVLDKIHEQKTVFRR